MHLRGKILTSTVIVFILFPITSLAQSRNIFGIVRDSVTGEPLPGVSVLIIEQRVQATTNSYGFYSLKSETGTVTLSYSHITYGIASKQIYLTKDTELNIVLSISAIPVLKDIIVTNKLDKIIAPAMSYHNLKIETIKKIPSLAGEPDLLKSIQLLPGVNVVNEGSSNLNVRGGSFDQNLILLDEAPVFNPSHALGFFSTFNADALRSVSFYKGAFPAQYGGRLSSVVDIYMKEGSLKKSSVEGGIGLLASRILWQGPIKKDSSSFIVSGRYSYVGHVVDGVGNVISNSFVAKNTIDFYDINAKLNFTGGKRDRFYLSAYSGRDNFYSFPLDETNQLKWGNVTATMRWNRRFSPSLFSNTSFIFSDYRYSYYSLVDAKQFLWKSNIQVGGLKTDFDWFASANHTLKLGFGIYRNTYQPGRVEQRNSTSVIREFSLNKKQSLELYAYISDQIRFSENLTVQAGLRLTKFLNLGPGQVFVYNPDMSTVIDSVLYRRGEIINNYNSVEPRLSGRYRLGENSSLKLSYSYNKQFLHLIGNSTVGLPTDVWLPADRYIKPQGADQFAIGYVQFLDKNLVELSVELYWKQLKNIIDYKDNANLFLNPQLETQVLSGQGRSYGIEMLAEKKAGRLTGWISYCWSSTTQQINGVNNNDWFPAKHDINHNLTITGNFVKNKRWNFSATFRLTSGPKITVPAGDFTYFGASFNYYSERNGYTLPAYHRLDFSATHRSRNYERQKIKREWVFSVFNVYNRYNIYALYIKPDPILLDEARAYKFYLHGIVPSASVNFKL